MPMRIATLVFHITMVVHGKLAAPISSTTDMDIMDINAKDGASLPTTRRGALSLLMKQQTSAKEHHSWLMGNVEHAFDMFANDREGVAAAAITAEEEEEEEYDLDFYEEEDHEDEGENGYNGMEGTEGTPGRRRAKAKSKKEPKASEGAGDSKSKMAKASKRNEALRECHEDLEEAMYKLNQCHVEPDEGDYPSMLAVQMGTGCRLKRHHDGGLFSEGYAYELFIRDMNDDTWFFSDRPSQIEYVEPTKDFIDDFDATFGGGESPNAAVTFTSSYQDDMFDAPLVSVFMEAAYEEVTGGELSVKYDVWQSNNQASVVPLESFFKVVGEQTVDFEDCSIFIDSLSLCETNVISMVESLIAVLLDVMGLAGGAAEKAAETYKKWSKNDLLAKLLEAAKSCKPPKKKAVAIFWAFVESIDFASFMEAIFTDSSVWAKIKDGFDLLAWFVQFDLVAVCEGLPGFDIACDAGVAAEYAAKVEEIYSVIQALEDTGLWAVTVINMVETCSGNQNDEKIDCWKTDAAQPQTCYVTDHRPGTCTEEPSYKPIGGRWKIYSDDSLTYGKRDECSDGSTEAQRCTGIQLNKNPSATISMKKIPRLPSCSSIDNVNKYEPEIETKLLDHPDPAITTCREFANKKFDKNGLELFYDDPHHRPYENCCNGHCTPFIPDFGLCDVHTDCCSNSCNPHTHKCDAELVPKCSKKCQGRMGGINCLKNKNEMQGDQHLNSNGNTCSPCPKEGRCSINMSQEGNNFPDCGQKCKDDAKDCCRNVNQGGKNQQKCLLNLPKVNEHPDWGDGTTCNCWNVIDTEGPCFITNENW